MHVAIGGREEAMLKVPNHGPASLRQEKSNPVEDGEDKGD